MSVLAGWLLRVSRRKRSRLASKVARILSSLVLAGGIVGFITFLIGIAVVPMGLMLLTACILTPSAPSPDIAIRGH
jgi:hypothetical protein